MKREGPLLMISQAKNRLVGHPIDYIVIIRLRGRRTLGRIRTTTTTRIKKEFKKTKQNLFMLLGCGSKSCGKRTFKTKQDKVQMKKKNKKPATL